MGPRRDVSKRKSGPTPLVESLRLFQRQYNLEDIDRFSQAAELIATSLGPFLSQACELTHLSLSKAVVVCDTPQALAAARLRSSVIQTSLRQAEMGQRIEFQLRR
jgi:hypothetical protein